MTSIRLLVSTLAALLVSACASPGPAQLLGLSSVDQSALAECRAAIHAERCAPRADAEACWSEVAAEYDALPDAAARKRYLLDAGCPSPRVEIWLPDGR